MNITLITEVKKVNGEKVLAAALEYTSNLDGSRVINEGTDINSVYSVTVRTPVGVVSRRTITNYYSNDCDKTASEGKPGRYLILEFNEKDSNSGTLYSNTDDYLTERYISYEISQEADIKAQDGSIIKASKEKFTQTKIFTYEVEAFKSEVFENKDVILNYRYFEPDVKNGKKYPLVIFLHGAGERGNDNSLQLYVNRGALVWASKENQLKNPSFCFRSPGIRNQKRHSQYLD